MLHVLSATPPATTTNRTNHNCSYSYTLRIGNSSSSNVSSPPSSDPPVTANTGACTEENTNRTACCVLSSQDGFQQCSSLSEILTQFNGVVGSDDCLQLELEQGEYIVSSLTTISVNYSLVMLATVSGGVTVSCSDPQPYLVNSNCTGVSATLRFNKSDEEGAGGKVVVVLDGVGFQDCPRPFQFDNLDRVTITDCWFR